MVITTDEMLPEETLVLEKDELADVLQNDVSQTLAAVLLWLQSVIEDKTIAADPRLERAETHLKTSIQKLVRVHYALLQ